MVFRGAERRQNQAIAQCCVGWLHQGANTCDVVGMSPMFVRWHSAAPFAQDAVSMVFWVVAYACILFHVLLSRGACWLEDSLSLVVEST